MTILVKSYIEECLHVKSYIEECLVLGHIWNDEKGIISCSRCGCSELTENFLEKHKNTSEFLMKEILENPVYKKVYNYIKNDFRGILNSFKDPTLNTEYNDFFEYHEFLQKITNILKSGKFFDICYNKKTLNDKIREYIASCIEHKKFMIGLKKNSLGNFPLNDREFRMFVYITEEY